MPQPREVVITGLGVVCPIGVGVEAYWSSLSSGKSGVDWLDEMRGVESPFRFAARVKDFDAKQYVQPRKTIKVMCHEIQTAFAAAGMLELPFRGCEFSPGVRLPSQRLHGRRKPQARKAQEKRP